MSDSDDSTLAYDFFDRPSQVTETGAGLLTELDDKEREVYVIQNPLFKHDIRLERDAMAGTGGLVWPAGRYLAEYLVKHKADELRGKTIVELGSGSGILGLCITTSIDLGSGIFYITDLDKVLPVMKRNRELNGRPKALCTAEIAWGETIADERVVRPDVLLMADCVYLESLFEPLVKTLLAISNTATIIYLCYKKRRRADARFFKMLRKSFRYELMEQEKDGLYLYRVYRSNKV